MKLRHKNIVDYICKLVNGQIIRAERVFGGVKYTIGIVDKYKGKKVIIPFNTDHFEGEFNFSPSFAAYEYYLRKLGITCRRSGNGPLIEDINSTEDLEKYKDDIIKIVEGNKKYLFSKLDQVEDEDDLRVIIKAANSDPTGEGHILNVGSGGGSSLYPRATKLKLNGKSKIMSEIREISKEILNLLDNLKINHYKVEEFGNAIVIELDPGDDFQDLNDRQKKLLDKEIEKINNKYEKYYIDYSSWGNNITIELEDDYSDEPQNNKTPENITEGIDSKPGKWVKYLIED